MKKIIIGAMLVTAGIAGGIALVKTGALDTVVGAVSDLKDKVMHTGEEVVEAAGEAVMDVVEDVADEVM